MKQVRVSTIENFRRFRDNVTDTFDTEEALIAKIKGEFHGNFKTQIGTAFHYLVEHTTMSAIQYDEFLKTYNDLVKYCKPSFPKKEVYPFSPTAGGDYLCLDYRQNKENPKVVYFTHDTFYGEEYETIADSFEEWYDLLYKDPKKNSSYLEL